MALSLLTYSFGILAEGFGNRPQRVGQSSFGTGTGTGTEATNFHVNRNQSNTIAQALSRNLCVCVCVCVPGHASACGSSVCVGGLLKE